jgi:molybdopterin-guanine dinucleotide biosynthesis protein
MRDPFVIGVGGFTSNVGKTTLICELLRAFPGWEAIKTTRGHYRSCGKDPQTCCVSHLLSEQPLVRSGRPDTYECGKDTGRYWDAGASNVHWLIATDNQIEPGIKQAMARVRSEGVFIEGNTFSQFVATDYFVMVKRAGSEAIKKSAKAVMPKVSALFVFDPSTQQDGVTSTSSIEGLTDDCPLFSFPNLPSMISQLRLVIGEPQRPK